MVYLNYTYLKLLLLFSLCWIYMKPPSLRELTPYEMLLWLTQLGSEVPYQNDEKKIKRINTISLWKYQIEKEKIIWVSW